MRYNESKSQRRNGWTRRGWLSAAGTTLLGGAFGRTDARANAIPQAGQQPTGDKGLPLRLTEFEPKSMLHVKETSVPRARFPVIDFHSHVSWRSAQRLCHDRPNFVARWSYSSARRRSGFTLGARGNRRPSPRGPAFCGSWGSGPSCGGGWTSASPPPARPPRCRRWPARG